MSAKTTAELLQTNRLPHHGIGPTDSVRMTDSQMLLDYAQALSNMSNELANLVQDRLAPYTKAPMVAPTSLEEGQRAEYFNLVLCYLHSVKESIAHINHIVTSSEL